MIVVLDTNVVVSVSGSISAGAGFAAILNRTAEGERKEWGAVTDSVMLKRWIQSNVDLLCTSMYT